MAPWFLGLCDSADDVGMDMETLKPTSQLLEVTAIVLLVVAVGSALAITSKEFKHEVKR